MSSSATCLDNLAIVKTLSQISVPNVITGVDYVVGLKGHESLELVFSFVVKLCRLVVALIYGCSIYVIYV